VPLSPYVPFSLVPSLRPRAPRSTLFPYTTLFRSDAIDRAPVLGPHRLPRTLVRVFRVRFDRAGVRRKARAFGQGGQRAEKRLVGAREDGIVMERVGDVQPVGAVLPRMLERLHRLCPQRVGAAVPEVPAL